MTANDAGDIDSGPNNKQNFPVLTAVESTHDGDHDPGNPLQHPRSRLPRRVLRELPAAGSHSGQTFLGALTAHTGADGNTPGLTFVGSGDFSDRFFTATATDLTTNDTSEFSKAFLSPELVVTTTADVVDPNDGVTSLREAIAAANDASAFPGPDTITFNIPANDPGHLYYRDDHISGEVSRALIAATTAANDASIPDIDPDWRIAGGRSNLPPNFPPSPT